MDLFEILVAIFARFAEGAKKERERQAERTAQMRAQYAGTLQGAATDVPPALPTPPLPPAQPALEMPPRTRATQPVIRRVDVPESPQQQERRLVEDLFVSPRSLAAAVIASEIIRPPVSLR
ncbi:MAG: hypothetical protein NVS2B17_16040 [Candidatus Velthaea sp.]